MIICLIPARYGSKRIKKKNIISFNGKPLIFYSINNATKSKIFDEVHVSTDSNKIKKIANKFNALTPYTRPKNISNDVAIDDDVIKYHLKKIKKKISYLCYLYPTTPMLKSKDLKNSFNFFKKKKINYMLSVKKVSKETKEKRTIKLFSQKRNFQSNFIDIGQFYWFKLDKKKK